MLHARVARVSGGPATCCGPSLSEPILLVGVLRIINQHIGILRVLAKNRIELRMPVLQSDACTMVAPPDSIR